MLMPEFEVIDPRFTKYVMQNVHMETLYTGTRWAEGPVYFPAGKYLLWSDIPNNRVLRYDETDGVVSEFATGCGYHNGHTRDRQGRLVSCEHQGRRISRIEFDGSVSTLAAEYEGKRLNSPNDVVVKSDGSVWFTDPTYGIDSEYEGDSAESEIGASLVYRIDPESGAVKAVASDFVKPNGLAFSPDESRLYIADTGATHVENGPHHIRVFDVSADGALSGGEVFAECGAGLFDGFRLDLDGNIWTSAGDGVHCYTSEGDLIGKILTGEVVANVEFGGIKRNRLIICATTTLRAVYLNTQGC
ncbi:SMP-30/gluconolactonase/LRE family protein [Roseobacter ponti]|uniref:SMP-30/gluconolactonase/LRE family protein n=1 Tax=Roseobacter ponti TaxID=1891787 RepID=A0A858SXK7_9RHOB|nr:SMP-30/gluconolactonase/LRE family protein [Roseobacter ponti]QJF52373.1 SMP-30/gluconolactonase/LRE family protein [Roseobacter ponti]